jgi:GTP cyclohydrolase II
MISVECQVQSRIPSEYGYHRLLLYTINNGISPSGYTNGYLHSDLSDDSGFEDKYPSLLRNSQLKNQEVHMALAFGPFVSKSLLKQRRNDTIEARNVRGCFLTAENVEVEQLEPPLVRIHSCCFTGETLGSTRCDCAEQLQEAMKRMSKAPSGGIILYLKQEGRGIGLLDKLYAYNLIDMGHDTMTANIELGHPPDLRSYIAAALILKDLNVNSIRLMTNNPDKVKQIESFGIKVVDRVEMRPMNWDSDSIDIRDRDIYLKTKVERMGHMLDIPPSLNQE